MQSFYIPHPYWKLSSDLIWWESTKTDSEEGHEAKVEGVEKRPGLDSCYEHSAAGHVAGEDNDDGDGNEEDDDDDDGDGDDGHGDYDGNGFLLQAQHYTSQTGGESESLKGLLKLNSHVWGRSLAKVHRKISWTWTPNKSGWITSVKERCI